MRRDHGSLVPVELAPGVPATLVVDYHVALRILHDPVHFPADPSLWEAGVASECPILPMMRARPNAIRTTGEVHTRYRAAVSDALGRIDHYRLSVIVEDAAKAAIDTFRADVSCDVLSQFAFPVTLGTLNALLGCSPDISSRAAAGIAAVFDIDDGATEGNRVLEDALYDLVALKRSTPSDDVTSWLTQHPAALSDEEIMHQLVLLYAAGMSPPLNLIGNTLLLMLTDSRFGGGVLAGSLALRDALDEVLYDDPPLANYCLTYPPRPVFIEGVWLPENQPVMISMAGCNTDPLIRTADSGLPGNRAHLAFGAGPHACPARSIGYLIAQIAIDLLLDALPDMELAVAGSQLRWQPGPFHRALSALPVNLRGSGPNSTP
ncbi:cytochrome P450 [Nocardia nova]|nr:cytochrome P450 [Nocardia nova]